MLLQNLFSWEAAHGLNDSESMAIYWTPTFQLGFHSRFYVIYYCFFFFTALVQRGILYCMCARELCACGGQRSSCRNIFHLLCVSSDGAGCQAWWQAFLLTLFASVFVWCACVFMCVTIVCAYHGGLVEVGEDLTRPCLLPCVRQGVFGIHHCVHQAGCPYASQNSASASHIVGTLGLQIYVNMAGFYRGFRESEFRYPHLRSKHHSRWVISTLLFRNFSSL